ncbi:MAG: AAA family ATPase [Saccharofermentans sp.]|nr:AAA family ATPase [Saccharofermentans sp.]
MLLGCEIINFDVFDRDKAGILIEESTEAIKKGDKSLLRLRNLNALIGRNSTGKTSFMGCLAYLKDCLTRNCADASTIKGRPGYLNMIIEDGKPCTFKIFFKIGDAATGRPKYIQYELTLDASIYGSPFVKEEKVLISVKGEDGNYEIYPLLEAVEGKGKIASPDDRSKLFPMEVNDEHLPALSLYGKITAYSDLCDLYKEIGKWFFCTFSSEEESSYFTEGNAPGGHKHLNSSGTNVINVLEYLKLSDPEGYDGLIEDIKSRIPAMKKKKNLPSDLAESPNKLFLYLLLLRDKNPMSTIFIETPDMGLYHDMVDVLSDEMRDYSIRNRYSQIIFSTHNPYIIESLSPKEIWIFERTFLKDDGDVSIRCAASDPLVNEMFKQGVGMGAIWYGGHLDKDDGD